MGSPYFAGRASTHRARSIVALACAVVAALGVAGYRLAFQKSIPPTTPIQTDWPGVFASAEAASLPQKCGDGVRRVEILYSTEVLPYAPSVTEWEVCKASTEVGAASVPIHRPARITTYCDGRVVPSPAAGLPSRCDSPRWSCPAPNTWDYSLPCFDCPFSCLLTPPVEYVECQGDCDEKDKCHDDGAGNTQCGNPVSLVGSPSGQGQGSLIYELPLFPLPSGGGFPATFSVHLFGQEAYESVAAGGPLGPRAMHTFASSMIFGTGTPNFVRVWGEDAQVIPFTESSPDVWVAEDGRVATLDFVRQAGCSGTALVKLGNGTKLTFGETGSSSNGCTGALREGRIQRIDRTNGDYLVFTANSHGYIGSVTDRRGSRVELAYLRDAAPDGHLGILQELTPPDGASFTFERSPRHDFLTKVRKDGDTLWSLNYFTTGGSTALSSVLDANENIKNSWTYTDSNRTRVLTEQGPGSDAGNTLTFSYPSTLQTMVTFTDANGISRTNIWAYASEFGGERSRVVSRASEAACPNCGAASLDVDYWPNTVFARRSRNANGFLTVNEDLNNPGNLGAAYDSLGNPLVVYEGCAGTLIAPDCSSPARRLAVTYLAGTRTVSSATRESAKGDGSLVTDSRTFDGSSARIVLDRRAGFTASSLDGNLDASQTRTTRNTYGGGESGTELTRIEGPYLESSGGPSISDPRTDLDWYSSSTDACTGASNANNLGRLKTITRWVDGTRTLVQKFCEYDAWGRAQRARSAEDIDTIYRFDWRGNVLSTTIDPTPGLNLETCFTYDLNGSLREIRLPRTTANGSRTGFLYELDDADRVTFLRQGIFSDSSCPAAPGSGTFTTTHSSIHYSYDAWGNRTTTEFLDASGAATVTESATYDSFNRLAELARPAGSSTRRTHYTYDPEGNLIQVRDPQDDEVSYGDKDAPASDRYDRFGRLSLIEQEVCSGDPANPDAGCAGYLAALRYGYDGARQLQSVAVQNTVQGREGVIETRYVTDDFGAVVSVASPDAAGGAATYRYDAAGRLVESRDPRGRVLRFEYDRLGRITRKINASPVTVVAGNPGNGTANVNEDGTVSYRPDENYSGPDSFTYTVNGRNGDTSTGTVTLTVNPVNDPPIAHFKMTAGVVGTSVEFVIRAEDVDDCELSFSVVSEPALGTIDSFAPLACTPGVIANHDEVRVTYTGAQSGFDEIVFSVSDGEHSSQATVALVVTQSGAALLGVSTEAHSALGLDDSESLYDGACTTAPCALESYSESVGPNSGAFGFARASRGSLAAKSGGTAQTGSTPGDASFAAQGSGFFTLPDLEFASSDPLATEVCTGGMNLTLNGTLAAALSGASGTITAGVAIRVNIGGTTEFTGTLVTDGISVTGTGLLEGVLLTENLFLTTPGFCVPIGEPVPLTVELATAVDADLFGADLSADSLSDYSNTFSFPETGPVFELPPGSSADSESGGIADNGWTAPIQSVAIDVKPLNPENVIPCHNEDALNPVALLTTPEFDALSADADSVRFEDGPELHRDASGRAKRHVEDADGDGDLDLVFHVRMSDTRLTCVSRIGSLTGATTSGTYFVGSDLLTMKQGGGQ